jgi:hypothetical protein
VTKLSLGIASNDLVVVGGSKPLLLLFRSSLAFQSDLYMFSNIFYNS